MSKQTCGSQLTRPSWAALALGFLPHPSPPLSTRVNNLGRKERQSTLHVLQAAQLHDLAVTLGRGHFYSFLWRQ